MQTVIKTGSKTGGSSVLAILNRGKKADISKKEAFKMMGLAACQAGCIRYAVHSKVFC